MNLEVERKCVHGKTANESEDLLSKIASFNVASSKLFQLDNWTSGHLPIIIGTFNFFTVHRYYISLKFDSFP